MDEAKLRELLVALQSGTLSVDEGLERLRRLPYEDLGFAEIDHHRALRKGFPEVILGEGKTSEQIVAIAGGLLSQGERLLVTRVDASCYAALKESIPDAVYHPTARAIVVDRCRQPLLAGVTIVCGGTSDLPVAEEAAVTAELMGSEAERVYDVGVAGLHRLLGHLAVLQAAKVVVAVAGMEGALPSVVAGLVAAPVIAVPTSVGYGASFLGLAPLLAMLNSCAPGVAVVNIDNGFGAGYLAAVINRLAWQEPALTLSLPKGKGRKD
ncbi:MAG: nickel pincer cofactor biosynthesis protein LarB [Chloroflexota bacterium]|nr:nickel pincer cofactor biosynthesis protein LarB [Chloroflexota bacterium]